MSVSTQIIRYLVSLVSLVHLCSNRIFLASIGKPIPASAASIGHQAVDTGTLVHEELRDNEEVRKKYLLI
jgi:hypothetical protein